MGLKPGEKLEKLGVIEVVSIRRERLDRITKLNSLSEPSYGFSECCLEGFPNLTRQQFVDMFCSHMKCKPSTKVTRIEFKYI